MWVFTVKFSQLFWIFEQFCNKMLEKEVKVEWVVDGLIWV